MRFDRAAGGASGITIGSTAISGGTSTRFLFNNTGVVDETPGLTTNGTDLTLGSTSKLLWSTDLILSRKAAANLRIGGPDVAAPIAQTVSFPGVVAGTSNTAGPAVTYDAPPGTGTGLGGSHIFRTAAAGSTGSAQNSQVAALTINSGGQLLSTDGTAALPAHSFASATNTGIYITSGQLAFAKGGSLVAYFDNSGRFLLSGIAAFQTGGATIGLGTISDVILSRKAAGRLQLGDIDAATAVPQIVGPQSIVAGTSNGNAANFNLFGSAPTGSGTPGDSIFSTALTGAAATVQNAQAESFRIKGGTQTLMMAIGKALQLGNANQVSTIVQTGYVTVVDSAGATVRLLTG